MRLTGRHRSTMDRGVEGRGREQARSGTVRRTNPLIPTSPKGTHVAVVLGHPSYLGRPPGCLARDKAERKGKRREARRGWPLRGCQRPTRAPPPSSSRGRPGRLPPYLATPTSSRSLSPSLPLNYSRVEVRCHSSSQILRSARPGCGIRSISRTARSVRRLARLAPTFRRGLQLTLTPLAPLWDRAGKVAARIAIVLMGKHKPIFDRGSQSLLPLSRRRAWAGPRLPAVLALSERRADLLRRLVSTVLYSGRRRLRRRDELREGVPVGQEAAAEAVRCLLRHSSGPAC